MRLVHFAGLVYTWVVYGGVAFVGGKAAKTLPAAHVMFGLVLGRLVGGGLMAFCLRRQIEPLQMTRAAATAFLLPAVGNIGWLAYYTLARRGQLSVIMPMLSLYVLVPLVFSLITRRDRCNSRRGAGVLLVIAAGLCLSVTLARESQSNQLAPGLQALGFIVAFLSWGASDAISSTIPRGATPLVTHVLWNFAGYLVNTAIIGTALLSANTDPRQLPWTHNVWWVVHVGVNIALSSAWVTYMALCRTHDGVIIVPLFSLYTLVPVLASIFVNGDPVTPVRGIGIALALCGVALLALQNSAAAAPAVRCIQQPVATGQLEDGL